MKTKKNADPENISHTLKVNGEYLKLAELLEVIYAQPLVPIALDAVIKARLELKRISDKGNDIGDNTNEGRSFVEHSDPDFLRNHRLLINKDL